MVTRLSTAGACPDIVATAARMFAARGYGGTSIQDIADGVGCSKAAVLYHFASKAMVLREILLPAMRELAALDVRLATLSDGPAQRASIEGLVDLAVRFRYALKVYPGALRELAEIPELHDMRLIEIGERLIDTMTGRTGDPVMRASATALILGVPSAVVDLTELPDVVLGPALVDMMFRALDVRPG